MPSSRNRKPFGAKTRTVDLSEYFNWPRDVPTDEWWQKLAAGVRAYPKGKQRPWGIPFEMAADSDPRVIMVAKGMPEVIIPLNHSATFLCILHAWNQIPTTVRMDDPAEGLVVAEYELTYDDGSRHVQPIRGRFEVAMAESPGPPWTARRFNMYRTIDPTKPTAEMHWGWLQFGLFLDATWDMAQPPVLVYAMPNPKPESNIRSLALRSLQESPLLVAGLTLYEGAGHPLMHMPRRTYRVKSPGETPKVEKAEVDLGEIARIERTSGPRGKAWLNSQYIAAYQPVEPERNGEDLIEIVGAEDATLSVDLQGREKPLEFSVGEAFHKGESHSGGASLQCLGRRRQWMQVRVIDTSTGKPTPARIHFSGPRGEYLAPHGHHSQINANWFEEYGADVVVGGRSYAYVPGEFTTDMPAGDVYVEICKGFEYEPIRRKVTVRPGQKVLELEINRWRDLRSRGWVTADTHVHFISPQTAWLEAQAEGVNVVNLLATQLGRLFTSVGDYIGRIGINEDDTIVYVGTENRNHMLGHISLLGTQGLPVFPMCGGGPTEAWLGDPDFMSLAEWALENKRKGGVVIRPHYPHAGHTEDPVPIVKGLVDAVEINMAQSEFPLQEWYRYLNCGYRVAVCGGTDKMGSYTALGWMRTYAKLDTDEPFTYDNWANAVQAGRTISTNGPLIDLTVEGRQLSDVIEMPTSGGTLEVHAKAESVWPLGSLEIVQNGRVVARQEAAKGARTLHLKERIRITGSGWIAARCWGFKGHAASYVGAHTSPVYVKCGETRAFDGPAAEHMLALVEGGMEYLQTLATVFDEPSRKRMLKMFKEVRRELKGRLIVEARHKFHHGSGRYHTHGHGERADHRH